MRRKYDFAAWFAATPDADGRTRFTLLRGEHYDCSQESISQQVRIAASHCGLRVSVVDMDDRVSVVATRRVESCRA